MISRGETIIGVGPRSKEHDSSGGGGGVGERAAEKTQVGKEEPRRKGGQRATERAQVEVDEL